MQEVYSDKMLWNISRFITSQTLDQYSLAGEQQQQREFLIQQNIKKWPYGHIRVKSRFNQRNAETLVLRVECGWCVETSNLLLMEFTEKNSIGF